MRNKPTVWHQDFRRLKKLALEVIEQVGHFERITARGGDDTIRSILVLSRTEEIARVGRRLSRRWYKKDAAKRRAESDVHTKGDGHEQ